MPKNNRLPATITRSLSLRFDVLAALDQRVEELRSDRSSFVNAVLEHVLGLHSHPEVFRSPTPFTPDTARHWDARVADLEREANRDRETKRVRKAERAVAPSKAPLSGGIVRRSR